MTHTLDAQDQSLGRIASKIAILLRGKSHPTYQPNITPTDMVVVNNVSKLKFTGTKLKTKIYHRYSGYPGGIHSRTLGQRMAKDPKQVLRDAVIAMLPQNRQRSKIIKHLSINL
ncbi:MAG: 50S ribosomal protein L13 [Candidatus Yanofskybacteria bacterium RIFCSPLOWO2_01_FULL_49_25]|uniref:Large ribosomal subunit protein uL13 n=1 Tax=Candidatus Yanofskybacteria bacterium RIFCSPLOWO2_01_FULL_49_25 TaxID=1802701 RepID=A0A1F8GQT7_9BACT|nr:MAG: 50S ribosomal protein L13 [Candidatus Yanofskybacteria bacterium RIFCSPLOWO2_01_FULL_49_25]